MKKLLILLCALAVVIIASADVISIGGGLKKVLPLTKIGASDTVYSDPMLMMSKLTGDFTAQYRVLNVDGNTKICLYWQESNDSVSWFNTTKLDSLVAADSALVECFGNPPLATTYKRWMVYGFGSAGDTSSVEIIFYSVEQ